MKFNCGNPAQRFWEKLQREENKRRADAKWHKVYAWFPTRVGDATCVWLEYYEKRVEWSFGEVYCNWYESKVEVRPLLLQPDTVS
jgi:hypothetical protein